MARLKKGALPTYRLHKPTGKAVVTIGGRDHYLGEFDAAESKAEYARLIAEYSLTGDTPKSQPDDDGITIIELLSKFRRHAESWYVKNGKQTNEYDAFCVLMREIKSLYGYEPAVRFGPLALRAVRQRFIDRGQDRKTVNKNIGRVKRIFKWAASQELIPITVYQSLVTVDGLRKGRCDCPESDPILPVDLDVVEATIRFLPEVTADMIRFQLLTGARPGEVCTLTPADVDVSSDVWEYFVTGHKTEHHGKSRIVYIGPEGQAILSPYLKRKSDLACFAMAEALEQRRQAASQVRTTPLSCGNRRGKRSRADRPARGPSRRSNFEFNTSSYRKAIQYACDRAFLPPDPLCPRAGESLAARTRRLSEDQNLDLKAWQKDHRWCPLQLRHTRATDIRRTCDLESVRVILGHADLRTSEIYAERDAEKARDVVRRVG